MKKRIKRLAVLASGNGTTLQAIIDSIQSGELAAKIKIVISNNKDAYALTRANNAGIKTYILKDYNNPDELYDILLENKIQMVVLAGYLKLIPLKVIEKFPIINTHPALLPKYGGKGMYGMNVHRAVVLNHEKETGATLHFVNAEYDKGKIIAKTKVKILENDTPEDVSKKVQAAEKIQLVNALKDFSNGLIEIDK